MAERPKPPWPPRGLSVELAAYYVGVSVSKFLQEVDNGLWPKGRRRGGRVIWDREALDRAPGFDADREATPSSGGTDEDVLIERARAWGKSA